MKKETLEKLKRKKKKTRGVSIDTKTMDDADAFCQKNGIMFSHLVDQLLKEFLQGVEV